MKTAGLVLAAGTSTRFGSRKQEVLIAGEPMYAYIAAQARAASLDPVLVVVPPDLAVPPGLVPVLNREPQAGLSRSLRLGLAAVPVEADAAVVLLGDDPTVRPVDIEAVLASARGDRPVVATRSGAVIRPPVLLRRAAFELAGGLSGDEGLGRLLRHGPSAVTTVDVADRPRDVDTPADLEAIAPRCPGCGIRVPADVDAPTHSYLGGSPGCWALFGEILAREFADPSYGRVHRHTVDIYAAQHPGRDARRQRQSVALHLIGLCHWLEHGAETPQLNRVTQQLADERRDWPWLDPPAGYDMTVVDVLRATTGDEHVALVRRWAESTWAAWAPHHAVVRTWANAALEARR